jgi:hypothetical protein
MFERVGPVPELGMVLESVLVPVLVPVLEREQVRVPVLEPVPEREQVPERRKRQQ